MFDRTFLAPRPPCALALLGLLALTAACHPDGTPPPPSESTDTADAGSMDDASDNAESCPDNRPREGDSCTLPASKECGYGPKITCGRWKGRHSEKMGCVDGTWSVVENTDAFCERTPDADTGDSGGA